MSQGYPRRYGHARLQNSNNEDGEGAGTYMPLSPGAPSWNISALGRPQLFVSSARELSRGKCINRLNSGILGQILTSQS